MLVNLRFCCVSSSPVWFWITCRNGFARAVYVSLMHCAGCFTLGPCIAWLFYISARLQMYCVLLILYENACSACFYLFIYFSLFYFSFLCLFSTGLEGGNLLKCVQWAEPSDDLSNEPKQGLNWDVGMGPITSSSSSYLPTPTTPPLHSLLP